MNNLLDLLHELKANQTHLEMLEDECEMQFLHRHEWEIAHSELHMMGAEVGENLANIDNHLNSREFLNRY